MSRHSKGGKVFSWTLDCHVTMSMVIVRQLLMYKKKLIHYSHIVWLVHSIYDYFFTHDKLMATYKKLTPSLDFLPLFNCNQVPFAMYFFYTLRICWQTEKNSIESFHTCLNIAKVKLCFSKSMDKRLPHFYVYGYCKTIVNVSYNNNTLFTHL